MRFNGNHNIFLNGKIINVIRHAYPYHLPCDFKNEYTLRKKDIWSNIPRDMLISYKYIYSICKIKVPFCRINQLLSFIYLF